MATHILFVTFLGRQMVAPVQTVSVKECDNSKGCLVILGQNDAVATEENLSINDFIRAIETEGQVVRVFHAG